MFLNPPQINIPSLAKIEGNQFWGNYANCGHSTVLICWFAKSYKNNFPLKNECTIG